MQNEIYNITLKSCILCLHY